MPKQKRTRPVPRARAKAPARPLTIVGVGASAGGLEAFSQLLAAVPPDAGVALILVQHLSPDRESALPALLASHTKMPVRQVTDGTVIARNQVYVIPPNTQMVIDHGMLALRPRPSDRTKHTPIDTFFSSLAEMPDGQVIAVVLSGTASDGALGISDVKAAGGITFAQQPESAKYDGMPRAAITTGAVDLVLPPAGIGAEIGHIARHPYVRRRASRTEDGVGERHLQAIFDLLRPASGVDFRHYKQPTIRRRLLRRMALHRLTEIDAYIQLLRSNPAEVRGLFQDLLIHVTRFFREPESFEALAEDVLPALLANRAADQPIRIWVCGCATGEEAYSLAMMMVEFLERQRSDVRVQIFATDVSERAIEHARAGLYPPSIAGDVGAERLRRFFTTTDGGYRVSKAIRDICIFARQDLTRDPPFSRLDLVVCRNVLIYLDAVLQKKLIGLFHYALNSHGFLMLGQAETVGAQASLFALAGKSQRIHRKKSDTAPVGSSVDYSQQLPGLKHAPAAERSSTADTGLQREINRAIVDRYAPSGVVVDADLQIVQFRGQTGTFLEPAPGAASLNLLKMAREGLLYGLRSAITAARKTGAPVRKSGLQVRSGHGWKPVIIEVLPLTVSGRPHYLILFEEGARSRAEDPPPRTAKGTSKTLRRNGDKNMQLLQQELAASRDYMQSIIQELESANEELQSANEEILSSNEELQSTNEELDTAKEELQSTNEELNTVNDELHARNQEMGRINSDLVNLVGSIQIAIVIVGTDLRIRRFTPMAEKVLNLIASDLDRSISQINPNIDCPNLERLIIESMDSVSVIERDVRDRQGRWFALRIRPYKSLDNKIDGAVLALFDIDILKTAERTAALARDFAAAVMEFTTQPVAVVDARLEIRKANAAFAALFGREVGDLDGRSLGSLAHAGGGFDGWRRSLAAVGTLLPPVEATRHRGRGLLRLEGRVVPSLESADENMVLVTVGEGPASQG